MSQTIYFATPNDMADALSRLAVQTKKRQEFIESGMFESPDVRRRSTLLDWRNFGQSVSGQMISGDSFLLIEQGSDVKVEAVEQVKGGYRYCVSQKQNPRSAQLILSGTYKGDILVAGRIATVSKEGESIYRSAKRIVLKGYRNIKGWYVSPEAYRWLQSGKRLTTNAKAPKEYDLAEA